MFQLFWRKEHTLEHLSCFFSVKFEKKYSISRYVFKFSIIRFGEISLCVCVICFYFFELQGPYDLIQSPISIEHDISLLLRNSPVKLVPTYANGYRLLHLDKWRNRGKFFFLKIKLTCGKDSNPRPLFWSSHQVL